MRRHMFYIEECEDCPFKEWSNWEADHLCTKLGRYIGYDENRINGVLPNCPLEEFDGTVDAVQLVSNEKRRQIDL